jgi:hypothetical protein
VLGGTVELSIGPASALCRRTSVCMQLAVLRRWAWRSVACHTSTLALAVFTSTVGSREYKSEDEKAGRGLPHFHARRRSNGACGLRQAGQEGAPLLDGR